MDLTPRLSEPDARLLARKIVERIQRLGGHVESFGVHLEREGFYFLARINGRTVWVQTGQGNFTYQAVAADLLHAALLAQTDPWIATDVPRSRSTDGQDRP